MDKQQLITHLKFEIAAIRQALRDLAEFESNEARTDLLLDRLNFLQDVIDKLEKE